jgi:hypothetical protein
MVNAFHDSSRSLGRRGRTLGGVERVSVLVGGRLGHVFGQVQLSVGVAGGTGSRVGVQVGRDVARRRRRSVGSLVAGGRRGGLRRRRLAVRVMHGVMVCVSRIVCGRVDDFLLLGGRRLDAGGAAAGGQLGLVKGMRVEIQRQDVRRWVLHVRVWCQRDGICAATTRRL